MEAIILAGGLGTRLRSEVEHLPKSMARINGKPFLEYLLDYLISQGVNRCVLSVGYKSEYIQEHFHNTYKTCVIVYAVEYKQLGTGGAIKHAMNQVQSDNVIVVNGDSICAADLNAFFKVHCKTKADVSFCLKYMQNIERYGTVNIDQHNRLISFNEKQPLKEGCINTGVYIFNVKTFKTLDLPDIFSIEKNFFERYVKRLNFVGFSSDAYFLDIGIPEDFKKAQYELGVFTQIDTRWTLFLDRDGVINRKIEGDYVRHINDLEILPNAIETIANLSKIFARTIIVTNQQGIGKKFMTQHALYDIHNYIQQQVKHKGGHIDAIYYAPQLASEQSNMRKPQIGMALQAKIDFPDIDFSKSIMVGDSLSDMEFGELAGMVNVYITQQYTTQKQYYAMPTLSVLGNVLKATQSIY